MVVLLFAYLGKVTGVSGVLFSVVQFSGPLVLLLTERFYQLNCGRTVKEPHAQVVGVYVCVFAPMF